MSDDRTQARQAAAKMHLRGQIRLTSVEESNARAEVIRAQEGLRGAPTPQQRQKFEQERARAQDRLTRAQARNNARIRRMAGEG